MTMFLKIKFVVFLGIIAVRPAPLENNLESSNRNLWKLIEGEFVEGDMQIAGQNARNALINNATRWTNKTVYYQFAPEFTPSEQNVIIKGFNAIQSVTCVKFLKQTNQRNYIYISANKNGCNAHVGMIGGKQTLNLEQFNPVTRASCIHHGVVIHESLHALGLHHQHCATNRDSYITVHLENVQGDYEFAFNKYRADYITDFGIVYDYDSIMHYDPYAFSKNGKKTIVTKDPKYQNTIGQLNGLSAKDIEKIKKMYKC